MYQIIIKNNEGMETTKFSVPSKEFSVSIGQDMGNQIVLSDPSVSGQHCIFDFDGEKITVRDLKSRNGVVINGERLRKAKVVIKHTDEIKIGNFSVEMVREKMDQKEWEKEKKRKRTGFGISICFFSVLLVFLFFLVKTESIPEVTIGEMFPLSEEKTNAVKDPGSMEVHWRFLLSQAKDAYFNNKILEAAKLFKEVLRVQEGNLEASTFLEQIKTELKPQMEKTVQVCIRERNIVSCAKAVDELKVLDPQNEWIEKANNFLEGYSKFEEVRKRYDEHRFKEAQTLIRSVVLFDDEFLAEWVLKLEREVKVTEEFKKVMQLYRAGPLYKAFRELKKFSQSKTVQKILLTVAHQKIALMRRYFGFKKLSKQDPLKRTVFGVTLLCDLSEKEDSFIYNEVRSALDELIKQCGPGTDFYILLHEDTFTQLDQARDYKKINEVKFALSNYRKALNGIRILAFFSKEEKFEKIEEEVYSEILAYHEALSLKADEMKSLNEFDASKKLKSLLRDNKVNPNKTKMNSESGSYTGSGDDLFVINEVFASPINEVGEEKKEDLSKKKSSVVDLELTMTVSSPENDSNDSSIVDTQKE